MLVSVTTAVQWKVNRARAFHDSSIVLRFEMISRARSWFIFSNTGCDAKRATTLPGISYCTSSVTCAFAPLGFDLIGPRARISGYRLKLEYLRALAPSALRVA